MSLHHLVMTGEASCSTCAVYDEKSGECRLYPAAVEKTPHAWCGQYRPDRQMELAKGYVSKMPDGTAVYGNAELPEKKGNG